MEPEPVASSLRYTLSFPAQEHRLGPGEALDPERGVGVVVESIDDELGLVRIRRARRRHAEPLPRALVPAQPLGTTPQRGALLRLAREIDAGGAGYPALWAILRRDPPSADLSLDPLEVPLTLDRSALFVQGPPGSGKTWTGARMIVRLLEEGRRVGVASTSHRAIHNLLDEVEAVAAERGVGFRGLKKSSGGEESRYAGACVDSSGSVDDFLDLDVRLLAGTAWLFADERLDRALDCLFVDEAGQVALADALAMGTSAHSLVLLGDPLQLAQVTQGTHPPGSGASVLEHLLADARTIPPDRGLFLERSFRMHPDVTAFVSEIVYEGRLRSAEQCARQGTSFGTGIRYVPVEHEGRRRSSEEAEAVAAEIARMAGGDYTDARGRTRPLRHDDFMVVAPYNAQVRCLREALPRGVRVGTVDRFQGQEAPVVFFSMASSSGEQVPRNLEFLFSRNRLNVAVSRARCLAVLVASPRLLEARCETVEQMRLVNALCRLVEVAEVTKS